MTNQKVVNQIVNSQGGSIAQISTPLQRGGSEMTKDIPYKNEIG